MSSLDKKNLQMRRDSLYRNELFNILLVCIRGNSVLCIRSSHKGWLRTIILQNIEHNSYFKSCAISSTEMEQHILINNPWNVKNINFSLVHWTSFYQNKIVKYFNRTFLWTWQILKLVLLISVDKIQNSPKQNKQQITRN